MGEPRNALFRRLRQLPDGVGMETELLGGADDPFHGGVAERPDPYTYAGPRVGTPETGLAPEMPRYGTPEIGLAPEMPANELMARTSDRWIGDNKPIAVLPPPLKGTPTAKLIDFYLKGDGISAINFHQEMARRYLNGQLSTDDLKRLKSLNFVVRGR